MNELMIFLQIWKILMAWSGRDNLSMPITYVYVYGHDVYIHDWIFDRRDKSCTKQIGRAHV